MGRGKGIILDNINLVPDFSDRRTNKHKKTADQITAEALEECFKDLGYKNETE